MRIKLIFASFLLCFLSELFSQEIPMPVYERFITHIDSLILNQTKESFSLAHEQLHSYKSSPQFAHLNCNEKSNIAYKIGISLYYLRRNKEALLYLEDSSFLSMPDCNLISAEEFLKTHRIVSRLYLNQNNPVRRESHLKKAFQYIPEIKNPDSIILAGMYTEYAKIYREKSDYDKAIILLEESVRLHSNTSTKYLRNKANAHAELGRLYRIKGQLNKAQQELTTAIEYYKAAGVSKNKRLIAKTYGTLSQNARDQKKYDLAFNYLDSSNHFVHSADKPLLDLSRRNQQLLAHLYHNTGQCKKAEKIYQDILSEDLEKKSLKADDLSLAYSYENLADEYYDLSEFSKALKCYNKSISLLIPTSPETKQSDTPIIKDQLILDKASLLRIITLKSTLLHTLSRNDEQDTVLLTSLHQHLKVADSLIIDLRKSYKSDGSKYHLIKEFQSIYEKGISSSLRLHGLKKNSAYLKSAYYFASSYKNAVLHELIQNSATNKSIFIPDSLRFMRDQLERKMNALEKNLHAAILRDHHSTDSLRQESVSLSNQIDHVSDELRQNYPEAFVLYDFKNNADQLDKTQTNLTDSSAILEYFIGTQKLYIIYIDKQNIHIEESPMDTTMLDAIQEMHRAISNLEFYKSNPKIVKEIIEKNSAYLYNKLIRPVKLHLERNKITRIAIIPDDQLHYIPFETLCSESEEGGKENDVLLKQYAISYLASSNNSFEKKLRVCKSLEKCFAGFATSYDSSTLSDIQDLNLAAQNHDSDLSNNRNSASRLPFTIAEIEQVNSLFKGDIWLNSNATRQNFINESEGYQIIHIAAHAFVNEEKPYLSALVFNKEKNTRENILLSSEIKRMNFCADLITLSACNTGRGKLEYGEGMMSLGRSFHEAGAPSVLFSLWNVADESTAMLMSKFYKNIQEGFPKDIALQQAKLEFLSEVSPSQRLPFYWAPFIVSGNVDPILLKPSPKSDHIKYIPGFLLILLFIVLGYRLISTT